MSGEREDGGMGGGEGREGRVGCRYMENDGHYQPKRDKFSSNLIFSWHKTVSKNILKLAVKTAYLTCNYCLLTTPHPGGRNKEISGNFQKTGKK